MATVTNGTVEVSRTVKPADYEGKSARVALSFVIGEGEDAIVWVEQIGHQAHDKMMALLRRSEKPVVPAPTPAAMPAPVQESTAAANPPTLPATPAPGGASAIGEASLIAGVSSTPSAATITDAALDATVKAAMARGVAPKTIKDKIVEFTGDVGRSMKTLEQEARAALVQALGEL